MNSPQILSLGNILVEVMRKDLDQPLDRSADFTGPYPSGASAIFIDGAAKLGGSCGYIGKVGADEFGDCVVNRLRDDGVNVSHIQAMPGYTTGIAFVMYRSDGSRKLSPAAPTSSAAYPSCAKARWKAHQRGQRCGGDGVDIERRVCNRLTPPHSRRYAFNNAAGTLALRPANASAAIVNT